MSIDGHKIADLFVINDRLYKVIEIVVLTSGCVLQLQCLDDRRLNFRMGSKEYRVIIDGDFACYLGNLETDPALKLLYC